MESEPTPEVSVPVTTIDPVDYDAIVQEPGGDGRGEEGTVDNVEGHGEGLTPDLTSQLVEEFSQWLSIEINTDEKTGAYRSLENALSLVKTWSVLTDGHGLSGEMSGDSLTVTAISGNTLTVWSDSDLVRYVDCDQPIFYRCGVQLLPRLLPWAKEQLAERERLLGN